jgi:hypothetical protein
VLHGVGLNAGREFVAFRVVPLYNRSGTSTGMAKMADEIVLNNRQARAPATAERGTAITVGVITTAIGVMLALTSLGYITVSGTSPSAMKLMSLFAVNMIVAGGLFLVHGVRGIRRLQRVTAGQQERPTQP